MMIEDERKSKPSDKEERHMVHVHTFVAECDVACEHQHIMLCVSCPAREYGVSHVHRVLGRTSFLTDDEAGHWHMYDVITGPAVEMPDGTHTHYLNGTTSYADGHSHTFADVTGLTPDQVLDSDDDDDDYCPPKHHQKHKRPEEE